MKVLHVISGLRGGGAEHFVFELCRHSLKYGDVQMSVLSLAGANEIAQKFQHYNIPLITVGQPDARRGVKAFQGFRALLKNKADVVHAHMFHACFVACMLKLFRPSTKVVFTLHNNYVPQLRCRLLLFFTRPLRNADIIFPRLSR